MRRYELARRRICGHHIPEILGQEKGEGNGSVSRCGNLLLKHKEVLLTESSDLGELLVECRVFIEPVVETQYDPKKHRILKMIPTEDETLNGRIANVYSDCYTMDSKVIYPAKIDILKK